MTLTFRLFTLSLITDYTVTIDEEKVNIISKIYDV